MCGIGISNASKITQSTHAIVSNVHNIGTGTPVDGLITRTVNNNSVIAQAPVNGIITGSRGNGVIPGFALEIIIASPAVKGIVTKTSDQFVIAGRAG